MIIDFKRNWSSFVSSFTFCSSTSYLVDLRVVVDFQKKKNKEEKHSSYVHHCKKCKIVIKLITITFEIKTEVCLFIGIIWFEIQLKYTAIYWLKSHVYCKVHWTTNVKNKTGLTHCIFNNLDTSDLLLLTFKMLKEGFGL